MPNLDSGSTMSYPLALRININKKQTNKQTELQCSAYLDVGQRYHLFQGPQQITLFLIIIIQNPLPFHHGCLSLEHQTRYHGQIFRIPSLCLFSVFHLYFDTFILCLVTQFVHNRRHMLFPDIFSKDFQRYESLSRRLLLYGQYSSYVYL